MQTKSKKNQGNYVASNVGSLAVAYVATLAGGYPQPFGIYLGDQPIGFLMIGYYPSLKMAKKWADEGEATPLKKKMHKIYKVITGSAISLLLCGFFLVPVMASEAYVVKQIETQAFIVFTEPTTIEEPKLTSHEIGIFVVIGSVLVLAYYLLHRYMKEKKKYN